MLWRTAIHLARMLISFRYSFQIYRQRQQISIWSPHISTLFYDLGGSKLPVVALRLAYLMQFHSHRINQRQRVSNTMIWSLSNFHHHFAGRAGINLPIFFVAAEAYELRETEMDKEREGDRERTWKREKENYKWKWEKRIFDLILRLFILLPFQIIRLQINTNQMSFSIDWRQSSQFNFNTSLFSTLEWNE